MLTRLWLVLSLIWAAIILFGSDPSLWSEFSRGTLEKIFVVAMAPLIAGLLVKRLARYVVAGD